MFIWMNLCRVANHEKGCMILGDDSKESSMAYKVDQIRKKNESLYGI